MPLLLLWLTDDVQAKIGMLLAIILAEVVREVRAWSRGKRLVLVEKEIATCLVNHPTPRKPRAKAPEHPTHGAN